MQWDVFIDLLVQRIDLAYLFAFFGLLGPVVIPAAYVVARWHRTHRRVLFFLVTSGISYGLPVALVALIGVPGLFIWPAIKGAATSAGVEDSVVLVLFLVASDWIVHYWFLMALLVLPVITFSSALIATFAIARVWPAITGALANLQLRANETHSSA